MTTRNNRWQTHKRTKRGKQTWTTYQRVNQHKTDFTHETKGLNIEKTRGKDRHGNITEARIQSDTRNKLKS